MGYNPVVRPTKRELKRLYRTENLSDAQIGNLFNVKPQTILRWRQDYCIPSRTQSEALFLRLRKPPIDISVHEIEVLNGLLLGDGNISPRSSYSARYSQNCKYRSALRQIASEIPLLQPSIYPVHSKAHTIKVRRRNGDIRYQKVKPSDGWMLQTLSWPELMQIYKRWYPKGTKIVPKNFTLSPISAYWWFIGDGCHSGPVSFATCAFDTKSKSLLSTILEDNGFPNTIRQSCIYLSKSDRKKFFDYIGPCMTPVYKYKWGSFNDT